MRPYSFSLYLGLCSEEEYDQTSTSGRHFHNIALSRFIFIDLTRYFKNMASIQFRFIDWIMILDRRRNSFVESYNSNLPVALGLKTK